VIQDDSLAINMDYTFFHERQITDPTGARTITDVGPFTVTREGRIVISEAGRMLTGTGSPSGDLIADVFEFQTTAAATYGVHRYRLVRTAP
jgi:hypothetical protein